MPNFISNALKCVCGWAGPAGGAYNAPPNPLIVRDKPRHKFLATPLMKVNKKFYSQLSQHRFYLECRGMFDEMITNFVFTLHFQVM